ncbi:MAG: hypothetical protein QME42_02730 [bacterium]|nr:hypothetical protein [bacterium]
MAKVMIKEKPKIEQILSFIAQLPISVQNIPTLKMKMERKTREKLDSVLSNMRAKTADISEEEVSTMVNKAVNQVRITREKITHKSSN